MRTTRILTVGLLLMAFAALPALAWKWVEGREAYEKGDYGLAIIIWTDGSVAKDKANRDDPRYYYWLACAYGKTGANAEAISTAQKGLSLGSNDSNIVGNLQWILGTAYLQSSQPQRALVAAQAAIAAQPQDFMNYKLLADVDFALKKYDDAITATKRTIELQPLPVAYYTLAVCYAQKGDLDAALEDVHKGLDLAPQDPELLMALGNLSFRELLLDDAAAAYAKAFEITKQPAAQGELALCRYAEGRYEDALAVSNAMIADAEQGRIGITLTTVPGPYFVGSVQPGSPAARAGVQPHDWIYKIDGTKIAKEHLGKSVAEVTPLFTLEQVVAMLKGAPGSTVTLKLYRRGKMLPVTVTLVREFLMQGEAAAGYALQSLSYRAKGDLDRAFARADKAHTLDPSESRGETAYGFALLEKGRIDDALTAFQTPTETSDVPFRQVGRALCYVRKGELDRAAAIYFDAADTLDPREVPLWRERTILITALAPLRQGHLEQARRLETEGKYAESLGEYAKALRAATDEKEAGELRAALFVAASKLPTPPELPEEARRHVVRGEVLIKDGDLKHALPEFAEALRLAPYMPKLYYNAALLNGQLKRYAEAIRLMNIYLQGAPDAPDAMAAKNEIYAWELQREKQRGN